MTDPVLPPSQSSPPASHADVTELTTEIAALKAELRVLTGHRFVRIHNSLPRLVAFQFVRGLALGLGTVIGATMLVSVLGYLLAQVDFVPILGEWATRIAEEIQADRTPAPPRPATE